MGTQKAIRLTGSDKVLTWPDDSIEEEVLEKLLENASKRKVDIERLVIVTYHERVINFNPDNPRYKDVKYKVSLKELFEMYNDITGEPYKHLTFEEKEQQFRQK